MGKSMIRGSFIQNESYKRSDSRHGNSIQVATIGSNEHWNSVTNIMHKAYIQAREKKRKQAKKG